MTQPRVTDYDEVWEREDFDGGRRGTTDEDAQRHYMRELGADTFCLCGDTAQMHEWSLLGTPAARCDRKACGCERFNPSPYRCPVCAQSAADPASALECCLCRGCMHLIKSHQERRPDSIVPHSIPCIERWCTCRAFGLVEA